MKTHKTFKKLRFSKETIANLNVNQMRLIHGGGDDVLEPTDAIPFQPATDSCNPCHLPAEPLEPIHIFTLPFPTCDPLSLC
jgi:hypothetical protein